MPKKGPHLHRKAPHYAVAGEAYCGASLAAAAPRFGLRVLRVWENVACPFCWHLLRLKLEVSPNVKRYELAQIFADRGPKLAVWRGEGVPAAGGNVGIEPAGGKALGGES